MQWFVLESGPGPGAFNMALDEALLREAPRLGRPVLRFYGWTQPAASFGYSQRYADVAAWTPRRPLLRRPTGGGLVPHLHDWTYSFTVPPDEPWYALRAPASYQRLHHWLQNAFHALGVATELAPLPRHDAPGQCFVGAELSDLLWQGRKIAGAAQRRTRTGLLIQGSIQNQPKSVSRAAWQRALCHVALELWGIEWSALELDPPLSELATHLVETKYGPAAYHLRR